MTEINVMEELTHQLDDARHSQDAGRLQLADQILHHSGLVHESVEATSSEGAIVIEAGLDRDDELPAMAAVTHLAELAIAEQLSAGIVPSMPAE
jgi:hypothetical protein